MSIEDEIKRIIYKEGFVELDKVMRLVLSKHPSSYYQRANLLGISGDFITAPEISQLFGEIIALWCIEQWYKLGTPKKIGLIEFGPGRGSLMHDLLKTAKLVPEFYNALIIQLLEINPYFISEQKAKLSNFGRDIIWLHNISDLELIPSIFIANEFFDALPIKQYIKKNNNWQEVVVGLDKDSKLKFDIVSIANNIESRIMAYHVNTVDGSILEESIDAWNIMQFIKNHIQQFNGSSLIIDYGYYIPPQERKASQYNSTLQAVKKHKYHQLLTKLGEADWSAHVDFHALDKIATNSCTNIHGKFRSQAEFLVDYGILFRASMLKKNSGLNKAAIIDCQVERLIAPNQMGQIFKVLEYFYVN